MMISAVDVTKMAHGCALSGYKVLAPKSHLRRDTFGGRPTWFDSKCPLGVGINLLR